MRDRFTGSVAVVSGGASGIGLAIACGFAAEGAKVAALDLRPPAHNTDALTWVECDVSSAESVAAAATGVRDRFGDPHILVHSAGATAFKTTLETTEAEFERVMRVNVLGAILLTQQFAPGMRRAHIGSIIHVASITGIVGAPGLAVYAASKGALLALTRSSALELAGDNVRVNCVCPASVDTPMLAAAFDQQADPQLAREANIRRHPLGRLGTPEDVAHLVLFLASNEAGWITGGTHVVDGGALIARRWQE